MAEPTDPLSRAIFAHTDAKSISDLEAIRRAALIDWARPEVEPQPDPGFDQMSTEELRPWIEANHLVLDGPGAQHNAPGLLRGLAARGELAEPTGPTDEER